VAHLDDDRWSNAVDPAAMRTKLISALTALFVAACSSASPAGTANGPSATATPPGTVAGTPGPSPAASVVPGPSPTAGSLNPGAWQVTLTGPRAGAGTFHGTTTVYCSSTPNGAATLWTATAVPTTGGIVLISLLMDPSGWSSVAASPEGYGELGPWQGRSDLTGQTAVITPTVNGDKAHLSSQGTFHDNAGQAYTIEVQLDCSSVNGGGGGTD
jgi:hypothetical protein